MQNCAGKRDFKIQFVNHTGKNAINLRDYAFAVMWQLHLKQ